MSALRATRRLAQAVGPAHHRVLLVQQGAQAEVRAGHDPGQRGVAAEADHGLGADPLQGAARLQVAERQLGGGFELAPDAAAGDPARGQVEGLDFGELRAEAAGAAVGQQRHADAAAEQFAGQRGGREHVPAGTAGAERDQARGLVLRGAGHSCSSPSTRRRVSASSMPMPSARASSEEPP
jgi:hypothetical protein